MNNTIYNQTIITSVAVKSLYLNEKLKFIFKGIKKDRKNVYRNSPLEC